MLKTLSFQEREALQQRSTMFNEIGIDGEPPIAEDPYLREGLKTMLEPKEVVDIGCGTGRVVPHMQYLGIKKYFGVDPMDVCIQYCKTKYPERTTFEVGEVRQLGTKYPGRFNGFLLLSILHFIPRGHLDEVLRSIHTCLVPNAPGVIHVYLGEKGRYTAKVGSTKWSLFTLEEMRDGLARNGFKIKYEAIAYPYKMCQLLLLVERDG